VLGCSDGDGDGSHAAGGSAGDSTADAAEDASGGSSDSGPAVLEVRPFYYVPPEQPVTLLQDGDAVQLWHAPQGGHVIVIGARVFGLDSEFIELKARIRMPDTGVIVRENARTVVMQDVAGEPGWKETDRRTCSQAAHVALCPNYGERDIVGQEYVLEVLVTELYADFSAGSAEVHVVPSCLQTDPVGLELCTCECSANFTPGNCAATGEGGAPPPSGSCPNQP
jgi:hypothetical protein